MNQAKLDAIRERVNEYPWGYPAASHPAEDRRALLAEVDRLRAAMRLANASGTWVRCTDVLTAALDGDS